MIAVSNTTPLRYLIAIERENLFYEIFETVFIPPAVYEELTDARTPDDVRRRVSSLPGWLEIRQVAELPVTPFPTALHQGEREAILLTEALQPDVLLIDDRMGREIALNRNLPVSGTLGLLERADTLSLLTDFGQVLKDLKESGFFIAEALEEQLLRRYAARRRAK